MTLYCWKNGVNIYIPSKVYGSVNRSIKLKILSPCYPNLYIDGVFSYSVLKMLVAALSVSFGLFNRLYRTQWHHFKNLENMHTQTHSYVYWQVVRNVWMSFAEVITRYKGSKKELRHLFTFPSVMCRIANHCGNEKRKRIRDLPALWDKPTVHNVFHGDLSSTFILHLRSLFWEKG